MGIVIGLAGYPGAGKTEVRKLLVSDFGFEPINSKTIIYSFASQLTGLPESHFSDPATKNGYYKDVPLRLIAAHMGYAIEDVFGQDHLIRLALKNHKVEKRSHKNFVIDSLRMNQPVLLEEVVQTLIVDRTGITKDGAQSFDYFTRPISAIQVNNNSDLFELKKNISYLLTTLGAEW